MHTSAKLAASTAARVSHAALPLVGTQQATQQLVDWHIPGLLAVSGSGSGGGTVAVLVGLACPFGGVSFGVSFGAVAGAGRRGGGGGRAAAVGLSVGLERRRTPLEGIGAAGRVWHHHAPLVPAAPVAASACQ